MRVTWEEAGWERLAAGVGRCRLPGWDCTVGLVIGGDSALLIDAGSSLAEGARLRMRAQALAGRRVPLLALTHPHFDHVFGAAAFAGATVFVAAGAIYLTINFTIISALNALETWLTPYRVRA